MLCALLLTGCAPQPDGIEGRYVQHIAARDAAPWREILGDFELDLRTDGRFFVRRIGQWEVEGRYRVEGDLLLLDDYGGFGPCRESGVDLASGLYRFHRLAGGLSLEALRDECRGRREGLSLRPWMRVR